MERWLESTVFGLMISSELFFVGKMGTLVKYELPITIDGR